VRMGNLVCGTDENWRKKLAAYSAPVPDLGPARLAGG
jgi:hypothetical protein